MTDTQQAMPPVKGGVVAYLSIDGAAKAAAFYEKAFGAQLAFIQPLDEKGRTPLSWAGNFGKASEMIDALRQHGGKK